MRHTTPFRPTGSSEAAGPVRSGAARGTEPGTDRAASHRTGDAAAEQRKTSSADARHDIHRARPDSSAPLYLRTLIVDFVNYIGLIWPDYEQAANHSSGR